MNEMAGPGLRPGDALVLVDVQNDFLPGGALAVPHGDQILAPLNRCIEAFRAQRMPIFATRDWHPADHCSFLAQGGVWPSHCVAGMAGADFSPFLALPADVLTVSKAMEPDRDAYSGFQATGLDDLLRARGVERLAVGGLATDYCVLNTVLDGLKLGYRVLVLQDAVRAVDVTPGDGARALDAMAAAGAAFFESGRVCG